MIVEDVDTNSTLLIRKFDANLPYQDFGWWCNVTEKCLALTCSCLEHAPISRYSKLLKVRT